MKSLHKTPFVATAAVLVTVAVGGGVAVGAVLQSHANSLAKSAAVGRESFSYGKVPAWLPADPTATDGMIKGTVADPGLTSSGDLIKTFLPHGGPSVVMEVDGPETPGEGLPFQATADTATFTISMSHATGDVPISLKSFTTEDDRGVVYHPQFVAGQAKPPTELRPGQTVSFELRIVMRVGAGAMRWAPESNDLLGTWDFTVEND